MSRRPLIAGNWKLNLGPAAAAAAAGELVELVAPIRDVDVVLFPTALSAQRVVEATSGTSVGVGVQWVSPHDTGAFTGRNSASMARELGCTWMLAGHSEARADLGDTDARVNGSLRAGMASGLLPMMALGEPLEVRESGNLEAFLAAQLSGGLDGLMADQVSTITLAYEPIWAIGTGVTATPQQAQDTHAFIRSWLRDNYPAFVADQVRILYGGSVKPGNAADLLAHPDIDGALVGGASLKPADFIRIIEAAQG